MTTRYLITLNTGQRTITSSIDIAVQKVNKAKDNNAWVSLTKGQNLLASFNDGEPVYIDTDWTEYAIDEAKEQLTVDILRGKA